MSALIPYNKVQPVLGIIPYGAPPKQTMPDTAINEQSFYASTMYSENPEEDYFTAKEDLSSEGRSPLVDHAHQSWQDEQLFRDQNVLADIASDPSLSVEDKKNIFREHLYGGGVSSNLRDRYKQKMMVENNDITNVDIEHRDQWLSGLHQERLEVDQAALDVEQSKLDLAKSFNYSTLDMMGGIASDIVALRYGGAAAMAEWNTVLKRKDMTNASKGWEFLKSVVFPGEANDKMNKFYNSLGDEDKIAFIKDMGDALSKTPGFDWNRWNTFRDVLDTPEGIHPVFKHVENLAGVLDVFAARGFLAAGFAGGFLRAAKNTLRHYTTVDLPIPKPRPTDKVWDRVDPTIGRNTVDGDPNPRTGRQEEGESVSTIPRGDSPLSEADYTNLQRPRIDPLSPAGTLDSANTSKAKEMFTASILDDSGDMAKAMGTDKGSILADTMFPKLDRDVLQHTDISNELRKMDEYMNGVMKDTEFDPFFIPVTQREIDKEKMFASFKESKGATYQQSNSVVNEKIDNISGVAVYGRNDRYGFTTREQAEESMEVMRSQLSKEDELRVVHKDNQWFIERPYSMDYDPYGQFLFGNNAVNAHFLGMDASGLAQSGIAKWIWHPTQRLPEWVVKGASRQHRVTGKVNADFMHFIEKEIKATKHPKNLNDELVRVQEDQVWASWKDFDTRMQAAGLTAKESKDVFRSYNFYRRLTDYHHALTNRNARRLLEAEDFKGLYDEHGIHIGNGTTKLTKQPKEVFDLDTGLPIKTPDDLAGRTIVRLEESIPHSGDMYNHAILGSKTTLGELPHNVINKIEGYVPRQNVENFYVIKTPKAMKVDGELVDATTLKNSYTKTIGAGATKKEAEQLAAKLQKEYPDEVIGVKADRSDAQDSIMTDHKVFKEMQEHSKKRGERLPTLYGKARLENPLEALWSSIQSSVRLDVWKDYDNIFKKNWLKQYGEFTKGEFPNVLTDIKSHANMSVDDLKQFKSAQRLFEQYTNQKYKVTIGDEMWKNFFHNLADSFENVVPKWLSQAARDTAGKGNILVRAPKALASNLFLYLNPPRQWLVQTQQLMEWSVMDKDYLKIAPTVIPALQLAIVSKASIVGKHGDLMYAAAHKLSGMTKKEFDATVSALYKEGIPQSVDLNMMLHGAFQEAKQMLDPSTAKQINDFIGQVVSFPGQVGKTVGYTPAELANTMGTWLFTRARWQKQNPGKNWNTPENIAKISGDAWEIGKAMSTRAGSMPYQDGAISLLFQFAAVQHKSFMEIFSSKTFTGAERAKLAAVRAALWGSKGLALGGLINWLIEEETDAMTQADWHEVKGGLVDLAANKMVDMWLRKPGEKPSDLSISSSMSPMPEFLPYADFIINAKQLFDNDPRMPRFAFTGAAGNLMKAAEEIKHVFQVNEMGTEVSLVMALQEIAKVSSGYNNYIKMQMLSEIDDKIDKHGNTLGLSTTRAQVVAQMFGIISKEEEYLYKISESIRDRKDYVETRAQEIHTALNNFKGRWGTPEYQDYVRVQRVLNSFTPEEVRIEVEARVDQMQLQEWESRKDSAYTDLLRFSQTNSDRWVDKGLGYLEASKNPKDQETAKRIKELRGIQ